MSKTKKWMTGLVPLLLVAGPVLADEAAETQGQQVVPIPARADEDRRPDGNGRGDGHLCFGGAPPNSRPTPKEKYSWAGIPCRSQK